MSEEWTCQSSRLGRAGRTIACLTALTAVLAQAPVQAGPYPGTGSPLAITKMVGSDSLDPGNPFTCPFLMDIAKSLAKSGLPSGFFLSGESRGSAALDLRPLMLMEAGILKSPLRSLTPTRLKKEQPSTPFLSMPSLDAVDPGNGLLKPKIENPTLSIVIPPTPGRPDPLSLDLREFNPDYPADSKRPELGPGEVDRSADRVFFRLWTARDGQSSGKPQVREYNGSFVECQPGMITSIEGRLFAIKQGRALACARGKAMAFDTPMARVTLSPGASAIVEFVGKDALSVKVLEGSSKPVSVRPKGAEEISVAAGEQIVVASGKLTDTDRNFLQDKNKSGGDNWTKGKFSPSSAGNDPLLRNDMPRMTGEQRWSIDSLKERLR